MDLNIIIYDNGFDMEKSILKLIENCYKIGYKSIACTIQFNGYDIQRLPIPPNIKVNHPNLKIYSRLTVKVEDVNSLYHLARHENLTYYDLLAIEPMNEKILNYLNSGNFEFDILTFSAIDSNIVNMIKKTNFSLSISKGIGIEVNYSNCLSSSSQRRQTLAFGQMLVDKTNSKNIILSSGTRVSSNIRSPRDVIYIGLLFGLQENKSKKALYQNTLGVIKHSQLRKNIVTSIIEIVPDDDEAIYDELTNANNKKDDSDGNKWSDETMNKQSRKRKTLE